jgi:hypothetical protein
VSRRVDEGTINELATAHLKVLSTHNTFHVQARKLHNERLQEEDAVQCSSLR